MRQETGTAPMTVAVLTISDRCSRGETVDTSGPALVELARDRLNARTLPLECVPDETNIIADQLRRLAAIDHPPDLVLTTGGTGLAPRDVTPEATLSVIERRHSGLMELIRRRCYDKTPRAYLSRGEAGTLGRTLIINLPGSPRGAVESLEALLDILPHAIETLRGEVQDDGRPDAKSTTGRVVRHADRE
ncbi:MAG: MogA/MoaB family molybdenum cofactor biosynthesis protein [Phycisphaerales bacterium]